MYHSIYPIFNGCFSIFFKPVPALQNIHSFSFLVVDEHGDYVLVDTGFSPDYIPGANTGVLQEADNHIDIALNKMGISSASISQVIMTHLHWDHTAGMSLFPQARFYVQAEDFRALLQLNPNEETYYCPDHWLPLLSRIELLEGTYELKPGLRLIYTGGHTKGHQVVEIETKQGTVILGGDAPFNYDLLWEMVPASDWQLFREGRGKRFYWNKNVLPNIESWLTSRNSLEPVQHPSLGLLELRKLNAKLVTSHDPRLKSIKSIP